MAVLIRKMMEKDQEEVLAMMQVFYDSPAVFFKASDEILKQDIKDCITSYPFVDGYIFEEKNEILGYGMVAMCYATEFGGLCIWIEDIYIKENFRNKGIGSQFLQFIEKAYPQAVRFKLEVETENEMAIATYKKNDYKISPYFVMTKEMELDTAEVLKNNSEEDQRILRKESDVSASVGLEEKMVSSEEVFHGHLLHVYKDKISLPDGNPSLREYIRLLGAVAIVPVTDDGKVIVEKQYRYPLGRVVTEIPAGKIDSLEEEPILAAKRELLEETGYTADQWIDMGIYQPSPAYCQEKIYLFLAKGLHKGQQQLDQGEFLELEEVPLCDLIDDIMAGGIQDGKSQVALLKASRLLSES